MKSNIRFEKAVKGDLYLYELKKQLINRKCSEVIVKEMNHEAIVFESTLSLPLMKGVVYKLKTEVFKREVELFGIICEKKQRLDNKLYLYKLYFMSLSKHEDLYLSEIKLKQLQVNKFEAYTLLVNEINKDGVKF
ncbi:hypothetical protein [Alkalihalobacillus pseudalcaliphilus]|uniref:hypothetical protein n=1 Tax=Alkalihalobacillus pseudalcaliphilus TaxID=79884 RepID=UPI00064DEA07|nr:hypothetical protein [Alkalihalobacillus pseudalcaliphilus]KMK78176.1 hypothetical protein AB990_01695 [Alkalihalobacillus pseudalcaliphilus]